jgi:hypothetical protein
MNSSATIDAHVNVESFLRAIFYNTAKHLDLPS